MARVIQRTRGDAYQPAAAEPLHLRDLQAEARRLILFARRKAEAGVGEARLQAAGALPAAPAAFRPEPKPGSPPSAEVPVAEAGSAADVDQAVRLLRTAAEKLDAARRDVLRGTRPELLELAITLARKVVTQVARFDMPAARANFAKALELAGESDDVELRVNPDQYASLGRLRDDLAASGAVGPGVRLVSDPAVAHGGVVARTPDGQVDATVEAQLDNVVSALLGPRRLVAGPDELPRPEEILDSEPGGGICPAEGPDNERPLS